MIFRDAVTNSSSSCEDAIPSLSQNSDDTRSPHLACRCGKGGAKERSADENLKEFCVQIPGECRISCPCFLSQQGCKNCNCLNCGNYFGKQEKLTSKSELNAGKLQQKRREWFVQRNRINSLDLISHTQANLTATTSWSELETILFEVIFDKVGDTINSNDVTYLMTTYNSVY